MNFIQPTQQADCITGYEYGSRQTNADGYRNGNVVATWAEGIQLQAEDFDLMAAAGDLDEIEEVNANCILMANLQQASTLEEKYTKLLNPITEPHMIQQNKNNVISVESSMEHNGGTIEQHPTTVEEIQFKSLAKEVDESLAKHKALEYEIERLLRENVSHDIMSIVQNPIVIETSDLQTKVERTKERFKNCINKKVNEYAKLWNDWYKKCEECKYDKIAYDKAYKDMQQKIERLQAQLGDQKGKSKDTLEPLSQKLEDENVELEFQVLNYAKKIEHLKTAYKNLFDSITVTQAQTKLLTDSLKEKLHNTIYENAKLRGQLFDKVSGQKDITKGTSVNTQFRKQSILRKPPSSSGSKLYYVTPFPKSKVLPKIDESNALSKPVTSNSAPSTRESKVVKMIK
ncbi:hypothetical protein Tco_0722234 [Tanacetum coccineum]